MNKSFYKSVEKKGFEHVITIYCAASIAMWETLGWRKKRILGVLKETEEAWIECSKSKKSMIQMLDEETGVEVQIGNGKSYKDLDYLNENRYGRMYDGMTRQKAIYIQARMLEWIPAQVTACLLLGLHRKQGFGSERLAKLYGDFQDVLSRYPMKGRMNALKRDCISLTGIRVERKSNGTLVDEE